MSPAGGPEQGQHVLYVAIIHAIPNVGRDEVLAPGVTMRSDMALNILISMCGGADGEVIIFNNNVVDIIGDIMREMNAISALFHFDEGR